MIQPVYITCISKLEWISSTALGLQWYDLLIASHLTLAALCGMNGCAAESSVFPCHVHREATPGAQAFDRSRTAGPCLGQRRQQMDDEFLIRRAGACNTLVALEEHFAKARCAPEVSVNLERRAIVKKIWQRAAA